MIAKSAVNHPGELLTVRYRDFEIMILYVNFIREPPSQRRFFPANIQSTGKNSIKINQHKSVEAVQQPLLRGHQPLETPSIWPFYTQYILKFGVVGQPELSLNIMELYVNCLRSSCCFYLFENGIFTSTAGEYPCRPGDILHTGNHPFPCRNTAKSTLFI